MSGIPVTQKHLDTHRAWVRRSQDTARQKAKQAPQGQRDTGPSRKTRDLIREERARFHCEVSGVWLGTGRGHIHHRRPRRAGGDRRPDTNAPQNLLLLSPDVHEWIENNRTEAHRTGLLLHDRANPLTEAAELHRGRTWLTALGTYKDADDNHNPEGEAA